MVVETLFSLTAKTNVSLSHVCHVSPLPSYQCKLLIWLEPSECAVQLYRHVFLLSNGLYLCLAPLFSSSGEKDPGNSPVPASQKPLSARSLQWNKDCLSVGMLMRNPTHAVMASSTTEGKQGTRDIESDRQIQKVQNTEGQMLKWTGNRRGKNRWRETECALFTGCDTTTERPMVNMCGG